MEDWKEIYHQRLVTADEAVKYIPNGSRVLIGHAANQPPTLVDAMCRNYQQYQNVELVHWVTLYDSKYCAPEMEGHLRFNGLFISGSNRKAVADNLADFTPTYFGQCPRFFRDGTLPIDVVLISVTPPNEHGYCSLGVSVGGTMPATRAAKLVIAQVNRNLPRTYGDSHIHVSQIDFLVEEDSPLPIMPPGQIGEVEAAIGKHCAALIEDGSTLQLGIGSIPDAVLQSLTDKKDLGIHSEMIADGVIDLCERGVINGAQKTIHKGKIVVAFLMGSQRLYDFVNNNPNVEVLPVDHVNDPWVIGQNHKMVSINSCLQVDFNGQVNSESIGTKQFSGVGGQLDYCLGGGLCYPAGADISIAVKGTLFGAPEAKLSVVGGSGHLSRILPPQVQRDMNYCGTFLTAEELHDKFGGVTMVVETLDELMPAAIAKAEELCRRGPLVLRYLKACMNEQEDFQMHRKNEAEVTYTRYMARHADFREGVEAFLEKREPDYQGK